jgi:hypothetical protein
VVAVMQIPRIWRGIAIIFLALILGSFFAITAREIFLGEPALELPIGGEIDAFSQPFGISNRMSFLTMHNTCVVELIGSEILDPQLEFIGNEIDHRLGDIKPGNQNYMGTRPIELPGKPIYGSFTFFVKYAVNVFGGYWARKFYVGTCQWNFDEKMTLECAKSENIQIEKQALLKKALERCN